MIEDYFEGNPSINVWWGDGVRLCSWFLRAVFQTKNKL